MIKQIVSALKTCIEVECCICENKNYCKKCWYNKQKKIIEKYKKDNIDYESEYKRYKYLYEKHLKAEIEKELQNGKI